MLKSYFEKWKKRSFFSKLSDILFILFLVMIITPQGRMAFGGFINGIKSKISQPGLLETNMPMSEADWQWSLKDMHGQELNLSELRGKIVFINLWATWCPPCVGEMPEIQRLFEHYQDDPDVHFAAISNESVDKISGFVSRKAFSFPVYSSVGRAPGAFASNSIPTSFLIDKKGNIVMREVGAMNWSGSKMRGIIDELKRK